MCRDIFFILIVMVIASYAQVNKTKIIDFIEVKEEVKQLKVK